MLLLSTLLACGQGTWTATTWGEDYIEVGIPAADFADGCEAVYDTFTVQLSDVALLDGDGEVAGSVAGSVAGGAFEMTAPGPQDIGSVDVPATHYDTARFRVSPSDGPSVHAIGALTCGADTVTFDWEFDTDTTYLCEPADLTIAAGGEGLTQLTVHGDHLFYDGLEAEDAQVRGRAIVDADADADGVVTQAELAAVAVAPLGYTVGQYSEVTDLGAFVAHLTRTLGHVDGEGHCQVDL